MRMVHRMMLMVALAVGVGASSAIAQTDLGEVVRVGSDYTVNVGERVDELVVISGTARVDGEVAGDLVVVLGVVQLSSTAHVDGDVVVVAGRAEIAPGASVDRDLVVVGGSLDAPPRFSPGGDQVVLGTAGVGDRFAAIVPWVSQGLFWGRPIVPSLPSVWVIAGILALLYLVINLVFERPVRACAETLAEKPLSTGLAGLLVLLLVGPVSFVLAISIIGAALVPFLWLALLVAAVFGRVGVARWLGTRVVAEDPSNSRLQATRSLTIGLVLLTLVYMVPIIGLVTWTMLGILGLGTAATTFMASIREENPAPPKPTTPPVGSTSPTSVVAGTTTETATGDGSATRGPDAAPPGERARPQDLSLFPRATFVPRLGAAVLDLILVMIAFGLLNLDGGGFFVLFLLYHVVFWGWKGTTVGGIICQLRIVRTDGTPMRFTEALVRGLSAIFSVAVAGVGWLWILVDADRQAWHDKIAGTYVVRVPSGWPLP